MTAATNRPAASPAEKDKATTKVPRSTTPTADKAAASKRSRAAADPLDTVNIGIVVPIALFALLTYLWKLGYDAHKGYDHPFASASFLVPIAVTSTYITAVVFGLRAMKSRAPFRLKNYMLVYNVYQAILNIVMIYGLVSSVIKLGMPMWGSVLDTTARTYDLQFWIWVHYTNKYVELLDTTFMVLRKKESQVSFLHVYHHGLLIWAWFLVCKFACGGDSYFGAVANSFVHVLMYSHYAAALLKFSTPWKKLLTKIQMVQFVVCATHSLYVLYLGNYPRKLTCLELWVMINMLLLFMNFYSNRYNSGKVRWTIIDGKRYDISEFMKKHPGGEDMLMLAVGRDATVMFHSYHRRMNVAKARLAAMTQLTELPPKKLDGSRLCGVPDKFDKEGPVTGQHNNIDTDLYQTLRKRVNAYFEETGLDSRGGMVTKSLALVGAFCVVYYLIIFREMFVLGPLLGVLMAMMGLAIQHDANHGAFHPNPIVCRIFGLLDDVIGGSALMWKHQHDVAHHAHPNDVELDNDTFDNYPIMRMNPGLPLRGYLRFQHIYGPLLYTLLGIAYPIGDISNYIKGRHEHVRLQPLRFMDKVFFFGGKIVHYTLVLGLPIYQLGLYGAFAWFFFPVQLCGGFFLATVFAVSHNAHVTEYNLPRDLDWAELQIRTSCNWGPKSKFWLYVCGGLNFQIEHHLFPGVAHIHYPAISNIVRDECRKRGIQYSEFETFRELYWSHLKTLYHLGRNKKLD